MLGIGKRGTFTFEEIAKVFLAIAFLLLAVIIIFLLRDKMIELIKEFFGWFGVG